MEAMAGGLGSPEQSVSQCSHKNQSTQAEDGGSGHSCLNFKEQQGVDGQCWRRKWLSFIQSTNAQALGELLQRKYGKLHNMIGMLINSPNPLMPHKYIIITSILP